MASGSSKSARSSRSAQERREAQRAALRKQREAELRRQRTTRTIVIALITAAALVLVAGLGYLIWSQTRPDGPVATPEGVAEDQPYLLFGAPEDSGKPVVELHLDFMCPFCGEFEKINGADIEEAILADDVTVKMVPRRFLDASSGSGDYSTRAANAFVCAYDAEDPKVALDVQKGLFENQPSEGGGNLDDEQISAIASEAGAGEQTLSCIKDQTYRDWVRRVAEPYAAEMQKGTPYMTIDGTEVPSDTWMTEGGVKGLLTGGAEASDAGGAEGSDGGEG